MGVPAFFRWLSRKCGSIVVNCVEDEQKVVDGIKIPSKIFDYGSRKYQKFRKNPSD